MYGDFLLFLIKNKSDFIVVLQYTLQLNMETHLDILPEELIFEIIRYLNSNDYHNFIGILPIFFNKDKVVRLIIFLSTMAYIKPIK